MTRPFIHLHTHTEWSNFDGFGKQPSFLRRAKEHGCDAIALTEHGTLRGITRLHDEAEEVGIRPIYGVEMYMCDDMSKRGLTDEELAEAKKGLPREEQKEAVYQAEVRAGVRARFHLTLLAADQTGLRNLFRITSLGWLKGFFKRPRVDFKALAAHSEGLIALTGCSSGPIATEVLEGDMAAARRRATELVEMFPGRLYGELMPHASGAFHQDTVNKAIIQFSHELDFPLVATQDAHYVEPEDWKYQEAMLCIHTRDVLHNPKRFRFDTHDFWLKGRDHIEESFRTHHGGYMSPVLIRRAMDTTHEVAERCQGKLDIDRFKALVPAIPIPPEFGGDEHAYLVNLVCKGWVDRGLDARIKRQAARKGVAEAAMRERYTKRLEYELDRIQKQKVTRYFLVVWAMYRWVHDTDIMYGPGRGSVGGCIVAFLLHITDIDPIEHELIFERFLSPDRIDMPDIDCDFEDVRREDIIGYLRETYGADHVAQIAANGHLTGKACLRDIARVMSIPLNEIEPVTNSIITRSSGDERASATIEDSFREFPICRAFDAKYPQVLEYAKKMEGQAKTLGKHAAGVVVAPEPLIDLVPLEDRQGTVVTAVDMYGVANLGLMKLDILGIRNLAMMKACLRAIKERHGVDIDLNAIPLDDKPTLDNFTKHQFVGIFQYDTPSADKICEGVEFSSFEDVSAMIALDRPGTARSGLATEYIKRKRDPKARKSIHPIVDAICSDTLGVIVYQEHVLRIFTDVAGFSPATADSLRRKIAKKYGDEAIAKERVGFVEGAMERGFTRELAEKLISQIQFFGCISTTSVILTPNGPRQITALRQGDVIWSLDADGAVVANHIRAIGPSGTKQLYRVTTNTGVEVASGEHWWLASDGRWLRTLDLVTGEKLASGRPPGRFQTVLSVEAVGVDETWDLETGKEPANYILASGLTSHNSYGFNKAHSVAYGLTSYRQMWLKTHYPLEFMWALLKTEPDREGVTRLVKITRRQGFEVHPPDVNIATAEWKIDGDAIVGSLADLKGVGIAAVQAIEEARPFASFIDFAERVNRRKVNRRVVDVLLKAGAMADLVLNPRWTSENLERLWGMVGKADWKNKLARELITSAEQPQWTKEQAEDLAAELNPVAFGTSPLERFEPLLKALGLQHLRLDDEELFARGHGFIWGQIIEIRYNQIGDFNTGDEPSEEDKIRMKWGARYSNINVEDQSGRQNRIKIDVDIYEACRSILEGGTGTVIAAHVGLNEKFRSIRAHYVVGLAQLQAKLHAGEPLTPFEWSLSPASHPVATHSKADINAAASRLQASGGGYLRAYAMVTHVNEKLDKKGGLMAFIGFAGAQGHIEVLCFASSWGTLRSLISPGAVGRFIFRIDGKGSAFLDHAVSEAVTLIV